MKEKGEYLVKIEKRVRKRKSRKIAAFRARA